jgi:hypothetical protein
LFRAEEAHTRFRLQDARTGHSLLNDTYFLSGEIALRPNQYDAGGHIGEGSEEPGIAAWNVVVCVMARDAISFMHDF